MAKRERSRVKSSIDQLPARTKAELEAMLSDTGNGLTYRDMADEVEAQCGIRLSTSAIQRYAARYNRDAKQLAVMTERMRMVAKYMEDHSPADLSAYVAALIQDGLMRRIQDGAEEIDDIPIESALKLAIQANRASTYTYRYRDQTLERVDMSDAERDEDRMNWLRGLLRNRPELLNHIEEAIRDDESGGNAEMVCDSGDDGHGNGVLPAPERAGH